MSPSAKALPKESFDISIGNHQRHLKVNPSALRRTVRHVLRHLGVFRARVSIALVDHSAIRKLKKKYFGRACITDVISFDLRDPADHQDRLLDVEVVVNAQQALACSGGPRAATAELHLYLVHGLLHQWGYTDRTGRQARQMHRKEDDLLEQLGFGPVYHSAPSAGSSPGRCAL